MTAARRAAHERTPIGVAVGSDEAEAIAVERARRLNIADEEHDVPDFNRHAALIHRRSLIHTWLRIPGVHRAAVDVDRALAADLQAHRESVRISATNAPCAFDHAVDKPCIP